MTSTAGPSLSESVWAWHWRELWEKRTHAQWRQSLQKATSELRTFVAQHDSRAWKLVPAAHPRTSGNGSTAPALTTSAIDKGKARDVLAAQSSVGNDANNASASIRSGVSPCRLGSVDPQSVTVHRRSMKGKEMFRAVAEVPIEGTPAVDAFRAVFQTPQTLPMWNRLVEESELIELLDSQTRVSKTKYRLGWPSSPRDTITISRTIMEDSAIFDVSTSLPRSPDAPAYLRPAPPYVRSHLHLFAWHIQLPEQHLRGPTSPQNLTITAYWAWDLKGAWLGMPAGGLANQLPLVVNGVVDYVRDHAAHIPTVAKYGTGVEVTDQTFDPTRDKLVVEYTVVAEDPSVREAEDQAEKDFDTLQRLRDSRRLAGCLEVSLSCEVGWDVKVAAKTHLGLNHHADWSAIVEHISGSQVLTMRLRHPHLDRVDDSVRVQLQVQRIAASSGVRLNGEVQPVESAEPCTPMSFQKSFLGDGASVSGLSISTTASDITEGTPPDAAHAPAMAHAAATRTNAITALVRRNYIYFTSLLQEPEAKWKPVSDLRGVTVTQLDSIDPTLVVYRAEATFVGVSVWDLYSTISSPGARSFWDKTLNEAQLIEDVNELSSLWQFKTKAAWPVAARDSVIVQTAYKSPASVHIFGFSTDDRSLFPSIPRTAGTGTIRTQVDLRGWSVEALSPTTAHITLLEQSDPKGWTSKSAIPSAMIAAVAGVGDYAIRFGGPPVVTRLLGAHATIAKYDHDKATYRFEYTRTERDSAIHNDESSPAAESPHIECELRCDLEVWSNSLDLVVDPPPIHVSCLRRHKLAAGGGGLWITIEHVAASLEDDSARVTVRKSQGTAERGSVLVNGARMHVDVDEMEAKEREDLVKRKRTKPLRIPLDLASPAQRRSAVDPPQPADTGTASTSLSSSPPSTPTADPSSQASSLSATSHLATGAGAVGHGLPTLLSSPAPTHEFFSDKTPRQPMTCALDVLFLLRRLYAERSPDPAGTPAGWALVSERNGLFVRRKLMPSISPTVMVQRGDKVVQGLSAEDLVNSVSSLGCRKVWDEKIDSATILESYGDGASTACFTTKASFPFRGRIFHTASLTARASPKSSSSGAEDLPVSATDSYSPAVFFHASASFRTANVSFPSSRLNPTSLPVGKVLIDGWILETLDPYASTSFQIPSTRCTHVVAFDFGGSIPATVNTLWNATLPRSILAVEDFVKKSGALPALRYPPGCVQVLGDGRDEDHGMGWALEESRSGSTTLESSFSPTDRLLKVLSLVEPQSAAATADASGSMAGSRSTLVSDASTTRGVAQAASASALSARLSGLGDARSSSPSLIGQERESSAQAARRAASVTSLNGTMSLPQVTPTPSVIRSRPSKVRQSESKRARQAILLEVEIDLKHYVDGYHIDVLSELLDDPIEEIEVKDAKPPSRRDYSSPRGSSSTPALITSKSRSHLLPLDSFSPSSQCRDLPVLISVHDLPPSAVLAATLDPSARPRRHLVRVSLPPENTVSASSSRTDAGGPSDGVDTVPSWLTRLRKNGALVQLTVQPIGSDTTLSKSAGTTISAETVHSGSTTIASTVKTAPNGTSSTMFPSVAKAAADPSSDDSESGDEDGNGPRRVDVRYEGRKVTVMHVNQTSAMLQRESGLTEKVAKLRRAPPSTPKAQATPSSTSDDLPASLSTPLAAMLQLKQELPPARPAGTATTAADALAAVSASATAGRRSESSTPKKGDGKASIKGGEVLAALKGISEKQRGANGTTTGSAAEKGSDKSLAGSPAAPANSSQPLSTPILNILGSYPLARLSSASTAVTNAFAGTISDSGARGASSTSKGDATDGKDGGSQDEVGSRQGTSAEESTDGYRLHTLLLVALVAFLLGSLVRGFAAPADYILMSSSVKTPPTHADRHSQPALALEAHTTALGELQRLLGKDVTALWGNGVESGAGSEAPSTAGSLGGGKQGQNAVAWRELRRLVEVKNVWRGWDVVLAVVRR